MYTVMLKAEGENHDDIEGTYSSAVLTLGFLLALLRLAVAGFDAGCVLKTPPGLQSVFILSQG